MLLDCVFLVVVYYSLYGYHLSTPWCTFFYVTGLFGGQLAGKTLVQVLSTFDAVKWSALRQLTNWNIGKKTGRNICN
jgi:hypothetical protein